MANSIEKFGFTIKTKFDFGDARRQLKSFIDETNHSLKNISSANIRPSFKHQEDHSERYRFDREGRGSKRLPYENNLVYALNKLTKTIDKSKLSGDYASIRQPTESKSKVSLGLVSKIAPEALLAYAGYKAAKLSINAVYHPLKTATGAVNTIARIAGRKSLLGYLSANTQGNAIGLGGKGYEFLSQAKGIGGNAIIGALQSHNLANSTSGIASIRAKMSELGQTARLINSPRDLKLFANLANSKLAGLKRQKLLAHDLGIYRKRHKGEPGERQNEANIAAVYGESPAFLNAVNHPELIKQANLKNYKISTGKVIDAQRETASEAVVLSDKTKSLASSVNRAMNEIENFGESVTQATHALKKMTLTSSMNSLDHGYLRN